MDVFKGCLIFILFPLCGAAIGGFISGLITHNYIQGGDLKNDPGVIYAYLSYSFVGILIGLVVGFVAWQIVNIINERNRRIRIQNER